MANSKYYNAQKVSQEILRALNDGSDFIIPPCSLHDQGYINYCIEKEFNLKEIAPFDYKDWFKTVDDIRQMLKASQ
jgi:hypothetical protein